MTTNESETRTNGKTSILDATERLLRDEGKPMTCGDIAREIIARGLWASNGKTPKCTLRAALQRELRRGDASRIEKVDGGFALRRPAAASACTECGQPGDEGLRNGAACERGGDGPPATAS